MNFQEVIKRRDRKQLAAGFAVKDGAVQFPGVAGAADNQAFAAARELASGDTRLAVEVPEVGKGNEFVQILNACLIFDEKDNVVRRRFAVKFGRVVEVIPFHAIDHFDAEAIGRGDGFGISLNDAMVGDRYGFVPPFGGPLYIIADSGYAVEIGHIGVQMQLDTLLGLVVRFPLDTDKHDGCRVDAVIF